MLHAMLTKIHTQVGITKFWLVECNELTWRFKFNLILSLTYVSVDLSVFPGTGP